MDGIFLSDFYKEDNTECEQNDEKRIFDGAGGLLVLFHGHADVYAKVTCFAVVDCCVKNIADFFD